MLSEGPRHRVTISRAYYLGIYPVTQGEYERVTGANPNTSTGKDTSRYPVSKASWDDATEFCRKLSTMPAEQATRRSYQLPTEAQWEFACRAGTTTRWSYGDDVDRLDDYAWRGKIAQSKTHPVGEKQPNPWRLWGHAREYPTMVHGLV